MMKFIFCKPISSIYWQLVSNNAQHGFKTGVWSTKNYQGCLLRCRVKESNAWLSSNLGTSTQYRLSHTFQDCNLTASKNYNYQKFYHPIDKRYELGIQSRLFSTTSAAENDDDRKPSSQVEKSVKAIKEKVKATESGDTIEKVIPKKSLTLRVKEEILHYYNGFKLLFIDVRICTRYVWRILNGDVLSRREHRQLIRTTGDLFRLVPFSVFIIIPFMEFLLPVALKLFPGMLPSTFETSNEREAKMRKKLKVKLEMVKFLQETLDTMSLEGKGHSSQSAKDFVEFFEKVHKTGEVVDNQEILKFSKLFEDEITLDSLQRPQLIALCRLLEMQAFGTNNLLRFQLRTQLRKLAADDRLIKNEGCSQLTVWELQMACKARGMRSLGMSEERLLHQMEQWLELSLDKKVPPSLLLLSRTLYLPENVPAEVTLAATISTLPDEVATRTKASIGKKEGKIENITKLEIIKSEEKKIKADREEYEKEKEEKASRIKVDEALSMESLNADTQTIPSVEATAIIAAKALEKTSPIVGKDELVDTAPILVDKAVELEPPTVEEIVSTELTPEDIDRVEEALEMVEISKKKHFIQQSELSEVKSEISDYEEDLKDLEETIAETGINKSVLKESKAARRLYGKVNKLVSKLDTLLNALDQQKEQLQTQIHMQPENMDQDTENVSIEELIQHLKSIVSVDDREKVEVMRTVLDKMDTDQDGAIKAEHVMKVLELLSENQHGMSPKMLEEVVEMMSKEEELEGKTIVKQTFDLPSVRNKFSISELKFTDKGQVKSVDNSNLQSQVKDLTSTDKTTKGAQPEK